MLRPERSLPHRPPIFQELSPSLHNVVCISYNYINHAPPVHACVLQPMYWGRFPALLNLALRPPPHVFEHPPHTDLTYGPGERIAN